MLAELDALYAAGWRGHVDFVDDNLIGNKKALKVFLPQLTEWLKARNLSVRILDRGFSQSSRRSRAPNADARRQFLRCIRRHRERR